MTEQQEIRAKALEIAVLILGERIDTKPVLNTYAQSHIVLDYDATLPHYLRLAEDVARYIRKEDGA
jgi:hypothetical protein